MTFSIGGLVVFGLLVVGVVGYAIKFRPPKVEKVPTEADLRYREWKDARAELSLGARWVLFSTNRLGVAAPVELAHLGALRAEALLIRLSAGDDRRDPDQRPFVEAGLFLLYAVCFALIAYSDWDWRIAVSPLLFVGLAIRAFREPARLTRNRRRLTRALFANHALIDADPALPAVVSR